MSITQKNDHTDGLGITGNSRTVIPKGERLSAGWCHLEHAGYATDVNSALQHRLARLSDALQQIASANLRRCSAGWLQNIAIEALESLQTHDSTPEP
jgi:hypothetical protein